MTVTCRVLGRRKAHLKFSQCSGLNLFHYTSLSCRKRRDMFSTVPHPCAVWENLWFSPSWLAGTHFLSCECGLSSQAVIWLHYQPAGFLERSVLQEWTDLVKAKGNSGSHEHSGALDVAHALWCSGVSHELPQTRQPAPLTNPRRLQGWRCFR